MGGSGTIYCTHCQWSQHGVLGDQSYRCFCSCHKQIPPEFGTGKEYNRRVRSLRRRDGDLCFWCSENLFDGMLLPTVEHLVPKSQGGSSRLDNLVLACSHCNHTRGTMDVLAFRAWMDEHYVHSSERPLSNGYRRRRGENV